MMHLVAHIGPDGLSVAQERYVRGFRRQVPSSPLTDQQVLCLLPLTAWRPWHNINPRIWVTDEDGEDVPLDEDADGEFEIPDHRGYEPCGEGVMVRLIQSLSTYDSDGLTTLVIAAHLYGVRVDIGASAHGTIDISMHPRVIDPHASLYDRHPGTSDLVKRIGDFVMRVNKATARIEDGRDCGCDCHLEPMLRWVGCGKCIARHGSREMDS